MSPGTSSSCGSRTDLSSGSCSTPRIPSLWGHDVAAMIEPLWPHLTDQVHAKDGRAGQMGNAILGDGDAAFATTARELVARGFRGSLISENDYHGARAAAATRDIAVLVAAFGS